MVLRVLTEVKKLPALDVGGGVTAIDGCRRIGWFTPLPTVVLCNLEHPNSRSRRHSQF